MLLFLQNKQLNCIFVYFDLNQKKLFLCRKKYPEKSSDSEFKIGDWHLMNRSLDNIDSLAGT